VISESDLASLLIEQSGEQELDRLIKLYMVSKAVEGKLHDNSKSFISLATKIYFDLDNSITKLGKSAQRDYIPALKSAMPSVFENYKQSLLDQHNKVTMTSHSEQPKDPLDATDKLLPAAQPQIGIFSEAQFLNMSTVSAKQMNQFILSRQSRLSGWSFLFSNGATAKQSEIKQLASRISPSDKLLTQAELEQTLARLLLVLARPRSCCYGTAIFAKTKSIQHLIDDLACTEPGIKKAIAELIGEPKIDLNTISLENTYQRLVSAANLTAIDKSRLWDLSEEATDHTPSSETIASYQDGSRLLDFN
jgi:hypothetical protein